MSNKGCIIDDTFISRRDQASAVAAKAKLYHTALSQDLFMTTALPLLTANELTKVVNEEMQWPQLIEPNLRSLDRNDLLEKQQPAEVAISDTAREDIDIKRLIKKDLQFSNTEL
jgi:hypothetical protein